MWLLATTIRSTTAHGSGEGKTVHEARPLDTSRFTILGLFCLRTRPKKSRKLPGVLESFTVLSLGAFR